MVSFLHLLFYVRALALLVAFLSKIFLLPLSRFSLMTRFFL